MAEWIIGTLDQMGYLGIAFLMILENVFPPIPSELIMSAAGFAAARGDLDLWAVIAVGTLGSIIGNTPWYYAGRVLGKERLKALAQRHGRWLTVSPDDIEKADAWFDRHNALAVLVCRFVPTVRTLISVPAGLSGMPLLPFLAYSTLGTMVWVGWLAAAGYWLGDNYALVEDYIDPVAKLVVAVIVLGYLYRVVTYRHKTYDPAE